MNGQNTAKFMSALEQSLSEASFIKMSLGAYKGGEKDLKNIYVRKILIKREEKLSFTYRYKTRDIVKNYDIAEAFQNIGRSLESDFEAATLFTTEFDLMLDRRSLKTAKPTQALPDSLGHDRNKKRLVKSGSYLHALGITDAKGDVLKSAQDKFRQINKYVEIMSGLVKNLPAEKPIKVVDMGSGKGYLTFTLYDYLTQQKMLAQVTGVEYRADLVNLCNDIAKQSDFSNLKFVQSSIADFDCSGTNILIALHACDTATDDAIRGERTVLDILDADQELLNAKANLARARRDEAVAQYSLAASLGLLGPENFSLQPYDKPLIKQ
jgi:SAM-dependent methyltransferase